MKTIFLTFLLFSSFFCFAGEEPYTLTVFVTTQIGNTPLEGITVQYLDEDFEVVFSTTTNADGKALFVNCTLKQFVISCADPAKTYVSKTLVVENKERTNIEKSIGLSYDINSQMEKDFVASKMARPDRDTSWYNQNDTCTTNYKVAEFTGGRDGLVQFLQKNIQFPASALEMGVKSKVYLRFIIDLNGAISEIELLKGIPDCSECDTEAVRVVAHMPNWIPASCNGNPMITDFTLPIFFYAE